MKVTHSNLTKIMYSNGHKNVSKLTDKCRVKRLFLLTYVGKLALKNFPESPHISVVFLKILPGFLSEVSHQITWTRLTDSPFP